MSVSNKKTFIGKHISVRTLNDHFFHQNVMLHEHFDVPEFHDSLFVLGDYLEQNSIERLRAEFRGKKIIIYQLEQLSTSSSGWWASDYVAMNIKDADEIWDYDPLNVDYLSSMGVHVNHCVPMLYTKALDQLKTKDNPKIDVLFFGTGNQRRLQLLENIQNKNFMKFNMIWSSGPSNNDELIENSKIILNLHAHERNRQEQVRMVYPVINGKTVISEISEKNNMQGCIIELELSQLANFINYFLQSEVWKYHGIIAKENLKKKTDIFIKDFYSSLKKVKI